MATKIVINTTNPSYSYTGKYNLPVGTDRRHEQFGKYQTRTYSGPSSKSSSVTKTGTYNVCRT